MLYTLENDYLKLTFNTLGAELVGLYDKVKEREVLWDRDSLYWNRQSPILFPNVGKYENNEFRHNGITYTQKGHGFARDSEFKLVSKEENAIYFNLSYNLDTLKIYPFKFSLTLGYVLNKNKIDVIYQVENLDDNVMYFQIGGHPAFKCPINPNTKRSDCYIKFENRSEVVSSKVDPRGYATDEKITFKLDDGFLKIADNLFEFDALVIENQGISGVSICDESKNPYVTVHMNVPIFGVWSINESAPFVCIEPWYGRCDRVGYDGELKDREYVNSLNPQKTFNSCYQIEII